MARRSAVVAVLVLLVSLASWPAAALGTSTGRARPHAAVTATAATTRPLSPGRMVRGTAGLRGRVDLSHLRPASKRPSGSTPVPTLGPIRPLSSPVTGPLVASAPLPVLASISSTPDPVIFNAFSGVGQITYSNANVEPADSSVAVGPDSVMQVVNRLVRFSNRLGEPASQVDATLPDFFNLPNDGSTSDTAPRVIYDALHGRYVVTEASWDCTPGGGAVFGHGYEDIAVSDGTFPGPWTVYFVTYNDQFPDIPDIGTSTDKVVLSANVYDMGPGSGLNCITSTFKGADFTVFDWTDLTNGGGLTFGAIQPIVGTSTIRPAVQAPATSAQVYWVGYRDNGLGGWDVAQGVVSGSASAGTAGSGGVALVNIVSPPLPPGQPHQPDSPAMIANGVTDQITDSVWQASRLSWVSTYPCKPAGDSVTRDCVRVTQLDTTNQTLRQDFLIAHKGHDDYMGGIGLSGNGALHMDWTESSATAGDYIIPNAAWQAPTDPANSRSAGQQLGRSRAAYPGADWGAYVGMAQDPQDPDAVWGGFENASGGHWETTIAELVTSVGSTFVPITPIRVLNTVNGIGLADTFKANVPRTFTVAGFPGIPAGAVAVTANVTVTRQTAPGFVALTPAPTSNPSTSTINFPLGDTRANNLTTPLSPTGTLAAVYKAVAGKTTQLIVDITGYFLRDDSAATYNPIAPVRVLNTVLAAGLSGPFHSGVSRTFQVTGGGIPGNAIAVSGNLTVTRQTGAGFVSITPDPVPAPTTSNLNFPVGDNRANGLTVRLSSTGSLSGIYVAGSPSSTADLILDVTGYYAQDLTGLRFYPLPPVRRFDSRAPTTGMSTFQSGVPQTVAIDGHVGVPRRAPAITGTLTVTQQTRAGYVSITLDPTSTPTTSTINFPVGDNRANGITVPITNPLDGRGLISIVYISAAGKTVALLLDITGYFI